VANQIIQWTFGSLRGKPGVLQVALDEATLFEHPADARGDLLHRVASSVAVGAGR
jgi:hypothetical protein